MKKLLATVAALALLSSAAQAQQFILDPQTVQQGMLGAGGLPPVVVGGTIRAGSTDAEGEMTASATSGSITFAKPLTTVPFCTLTDASATPTAVYTTSATAFTLTTIVSAHIYHWHCAAQQAF